MPLSQGLADTILRHPCRNCGHVLEKPGSRFSVVSKYTCAGCNVQMRLRYDEKLRIFARHQRGAPDS